MDKYVRVTVCYLCFILLTVNASFAKEWRGIIPLHSTRADVLRILGEPLIDDYIYDVDEGRVNIMYVRQTCEQGLPSNWGNWNVPVDTVREITIHLKKDIIFADLNIPDKDKLKWYTDDTQTTYYHDKKQGIEYSVSGEGLVRSISYGPTAKDEHLLCKKIVPKIKY